jgi:hypothetical protein
MNWLAHARGVSFWFMAPTNFSPFLLFSSLASSITTCRTGD